MKNEDKKVRVITYGTYDMLHHGHVRLLKRAKELGDYLIVGVTAEDFDKNRGKINVKQSLMERIEAVKATGLADEIIVEEYEGQKIDDIKRYDVDIFTVGSDWIGKFDYLNEYCKVVYLERTEGISSTQLRSEENVTRLGLVSDFDNIGKYIKETTYVNGIEVTGAFTHNNEINSIFENNNIKLYDEYESLIENVDAVYIASLPAKHYEQILYALDNGVNVLCETPISIKADDARELYYKAKAKGLVLMEANKTAFATAYNRLMLLAKGGKIGKVVSVDATCTSLDERLNDSNYRRTSQNSMCAWGTIAMLPVLQILGTEYKSLEFTTLYGDDKFDLFTRMNFIYDSAIANLKVGKGVKSEGELVITGTKGYIYVPAPWWKTDYFEIRYENQNMNRRYFYQLDGEGIRYELVAFVKSITNGKDQSYIDNEMSILMSGIIEKFDKGENVTEIKIEE